MEKNKVTINDLLKEYSKESLDYEFRNKKAETYYLELLNKNNGSINTEKYYGVSLNEFKERIDIWCDNCSSPRCPLLCLHPALFFKKK